MKSFLRAAAATGVAAATLAAGLSFGPAASASSNHAQTPESPGTPFKVVTGEINGKYWSYNKDDFVVSAHDRLEEAQQSGVTFYAVYEETEGGFDWYRLWKGEDRRACVYAYEYLAISYSAYCTEDVSLWGVVDGRLRAKESRAEGSVWLTSKFNNLIQLGLTTSKARPSDADYNFVGLPEHLGRLTASVADVDLEAGTAKLVDGTAPDDAETIDVAWTTADGSPRKRTATVVDGKWERQLNDLPLGKTTVHLTAYVGADVVAENDLEVDLAVSELTATPTFDDDVEQVAHVTGTATPNTTIKAFHGDRPVQTTMSDADGAYSLAINPPNMGGPYDLQIVQEIRGEQASTKGVRLEYGIAVSIDSPENDEQLDPGDDLVISGKAQPGAKLTVAEQDSDTPLKELTVGTNGTYRAFIDGDILEDREYKLVVTGVSKGYNITSAEVTINPGKSTIAPIEGRLEFPGALTDDAHIVGSGEAGAAVSIKNGDDEIGTGTVDSSGAFDIAISSPGPGSHTLTLTETKGDASKSKDLPVDFGAAVTAAVDGSSTITGSTATITGTGTDGAKIVVTEDGKQVAETTVQDGGYSVPIEHIQDGEHDYTVTQTARGNTLSSEDVQVTRDAPITDVTLTSPKSGDTHAPNSAVRFAGTGTPGARVVVHAGTGLADFDTIVDADGNWHVDRPVTTGTWFFDVIQTAKGGHVSRIDGIELPEEGMAVDRPFEVTAPTSGSTHVDESVIFEGTGTPGSTITLDPKNPGLATATTQVGLNGRWSVNRWISGAKFEFDVIQSKDGVETGRKTIRINQSAEVVKPFAVTSPEDGADLKDQLAAFRGTGAAGSTVTLDPNNPGLATLTTTVDADGEWKIDRWLGSGSYEFSVIQTTNSAETGRVTIRLNQPEDVVKPFAVTSPENGADLKDQLAVFRGTGTAGSTITVDPNNPGLATVTTTVNSDGEWQVGRWLGAGSYHFTVTQTTDGEPNGSTDLDLNPATD